LKRAPQPKIAKEALNPFILKFQGHSKSSMLISQKARHLCLLCMALSICNRVHAQGCDRRTDRQAPKPWLRRAKHFMLSRVKIQLQLEVGISNRLMPGASVKAWSLKHKIRLIRR